MTPLKIIAGMIDREKHKAEGVKRLKENYGRFMPKVVRDELPGFSGRKEADDQAQRV